MKLPNRFGTIYKLSGNRRKPYRAMVSLGYIYKDGKVVPNRRTLGYFETKKKAIQALTEYNEDPYDLDGKDMTFKEVYEKWAKDHFKTLSNKSAMRTYTAAFNHSIMLHDMIFKNIKVMHLEKAIEIADTGTSTKSRMKSLFNLMYKFAIKHEIVQKNYAELCRSVKVEKTLERVPFSSEEVKILWENIDDIPYVDIVLIGIYSGFRPIELAMLLCKDMHFEEGYMVGGAKTEAGRDRIVPIHPKIKHLLEKYYDPNNEYLFNVYSRKRNEVYPLNYNRYRRVFEKVMKELEMDHNPHETRHTFITQAKKCNVNDFILKRIVGHEIKDVTEGVYTHRNIENFILEIKKIEF